VASIHDRTPLLLEPEDWPLWLGRGTGNADTLQMIDSTTVQSQVFR
jgi:putative SOS response-associated peptidase YedK